MLTLTHYQFIKINSSVQTFLYVSGNNYNLQVTKALFVVTTTFQVTVNDTLKNMQLNITAPTGMEDKNLSYTAYCILANSTYNTDSVCGLK